MFEFRNLYWSHSSEYVITFATLFYNLEWRKSIIMPGPSTSQLFLSVYKRRLQQRDTAPVLQRRKFFYVTFYNDIFTIVKTRQLATKKLLSTTYYQRWMLHKSILTPWDCYLFYIIVTQCPKHFTIKLPKCTPLYVCLLHF